VTSVQIPISQTYTSAFQVRDHMREFLQDFGVQQGWVLLASLLSIRFHSKFVAFLDAPNSRSLSDVLAFEDEIRRTRASMNGNTPRRSPAR
jgi:hypothetical protein